MLEVFPQKRFFGYKWGGGGWLETKWYHRNIRTTKTRFVVHWASSHVLYGLLCRYAPNELKI